MFFSLEKMFMRDYIEDEILTLKQLGHGLSKSQFHNKYSSCFL